MKYAKDGQIFWSRNKFLFYRHVSILVTFQDLAKCRLSHNKKTPSKIVMSKFTVPEVDYIPFVFKCLCHSRLLSECTSIIHYFHFNRFALSIVNYQKLV